MCTRPNANVYVYAAVAGIDASEMMDVDLLPPGVDAPPPPGQSNNNPPYLGLS